MEDWLVELLEFSITPSVRDAHDYYLSILVADFPDL
jgi:hypothetical protein